MDEEQQLDEMRDASGLAKVASLEDEGQQHFGASKSDALSILLMRSSSNSRALCKSLEYTRTRTVWVDDYFDLDLMDLSGRDVMDCSIHFSASSREPWHTDLAGDRKRLSEMFAEFLNRRSDMLARSAEAHE
ncbi:MAG: hypothetical protein F4Y95_01885 [Chloroflexi bacterium]|nr:hypothetical protein [Chloroflexota bacterium]